MKQLRLTYPALFPIASVGDIAARNPGQFSVGDMLVVLAAVTILTGIILTFAQVTARRRGIDTSDRAVSLCLVGVAWFFFFLPAQQVVAMVSWRLSQGIVLVPLGLVATTALVFLIFRAGRERLQAVNNFFAYFGLALVGLGAFRLIGGITSATGSGRSPFARQLAEPVPIIGSKQGAAATKRDVYLFVLDGHANAQARREVLHDSSTAFEDSLQALGFVVPRTMHSNYAETVLSLPSLLNFEHVTELARDVGERSTDYSLPKYLIEQNRAARFLKAQGYRYLLFPSSWWDADQFSPLADEIFRATPGFDLFEELRRTELRLAVARSTLMEPWVHPTRSSELRKYDGITRVADDSSATFAFAHVLAPHPPFLLDASCQPLARPFVIGEETNNPEQRRAYLDQMRCVDGVTLKSIREILRRSAIPPIILVVGDHGSRFSDVQFYQHPREVSPLFLRERFGAFGAFYVPAGGDSLFRGSVTLVNVFRHVLSYYFGADLPPRPDDLFISGDHPYQFTPVDRSALALDSFARSGPAAPNDDRERHVRTLTPPYLKVARRPGRPAR